MENFKELFEKATQVSDKRKKVFNQLKEKVKTEILPDFAKAINDLGYKDVFFSSSLPIISGHDENSLYEEDGYPYVFCIRYYDNTGWICEAGKDSYTGDLTHADYKDFSFDEVDLTNQGIIDLVKQLNKRLLGLIERRKEENEEAKLFLEQKKS